MAILGNSRILILDEPTSGKHSPANLGLPLQMPWCIWSACETDYGGFIAPLRHKILKSLDHAGVDPASRRAFWEVLAELQPKYATLLITQFPDEAEHLADKVKLSLILV